MADAAPDKERSTRDRILDAAEAIVEREGARRLTIDAVVRESGLSKGGVLYHFASKLALVEGMVQRLVATVEADLAAARADAEAKDEPVLPAVIHVVLHHRKQNSRVSMGVLAAAAENPELLDPVRDFLTRIRQQILDQAADPDLARIVLLAADGLHFADILGLDFLTPDDRSAVEARLVRLVSESCR
ncbi:TetR family transcriptional regulator [Marinicauda salina]|uniref:TetR family transcriptional regulator n=1 Tax=Marinicauda salina TaxID=2135793 RepID=A0A2U2BVT9_9PROT|nr:TetR/AcrR family transcriptional regulator [Marinicauda salina]PWE18099.1 TetR family transcriptional regulator [Marinicauda salina]